jgi:hypothetical protein
MCLLKILSIFSGFFCISQLTEQSNTAATGPVRFNTQSRHWTCSQACSTHFPFSQPVSLITILKVNPLSPQTLKCICATDFPHQNFACFPYIPILTTLPGYHSLLDFTTLNWPLTSAFLSNVFLSTLYSDTCTLYSSSAV